MRSRAPARHDASKRAGCAGSLLTTSFPQTSMFASVFHQKSLTWNVWRGCFMGCFIPKHEGGDQLCNREVASS